MEQYKYMVAVRCMTYNHAPYIEDALRGFSIQEADFPIVNIIIDDASSDGTQEVLKKWADEYLEHETNYCHWQEKPYGRLAVSPLARNKNLTFVIILLNFNHYRIGLKWNKFDYMAEWNENSKYQATCEGDDYWTDREKLKKQVHFLESNTNYSFCVHNFSRYDEVEKTMTIGFKYDSDFSFDIKGYLKYWPTQPLTSLVRTTAAPSVEIRKKYRLYRDNHHFYLLLKQGLGYYMSDVMGVYRITHKGVWTSLDNIGKLKIDVDCFIDIYRHHRGDLYLWAKCVGMYSHYIAKSLHAKAKIDKISILDLGILGVALAYVRALYLLLFFYN